MPQHLEKKKANKEAKASNYSGLKGFTFVRVTHASNYSAGQTQELIQMSAERVQFGERHVSIRRLVRKRKNAAHLEEIRGNDSVVQVNEMVKYHRATVKKHRIRFGSP